MSVFVPPPKPTGRTVPTVATLTGCLFPWGADEQPVLLAMPGTDTDYLPVFTSADKLEVTMDTVKVAYAKIKQIMDSDEFLSSIPLDIEIIVDPWITLEGKVRYVRYDR